MSGCNPSEYTVKRLLGNCTDCSTLKDDFRICKEPQCVFLCIHMYSCDSKCYDYTNYHIMCKHIHRVHALFYHNLPKISTAPEIDIDGPDNHTGYMESVFDPNRCRCIYDRCTHFLHLIKPRLHNST